MADILSPLIKRLRIYLLLLWRIQVSFQVKTLTVFDFLLNKNRECSWTLSRFVASVPETNATNVGFGTRAAG